MNCREFGEKARLGMAARGGRPWQDVVVGRIVGLTKPRYGAWIKDQKTGEVHYFDSTWIALVEPR
jgi:hypothetical protein